MVTDEKILDYIDENLSDKERESIEMMISENEELRVRYQLLKDVDKSLRSEKLASPPSNFVSQVMQSVLNPNTEQGKFFGKTRLIVLSILVFAFLGTLYFLAIKFMPSTENLITDQVTIRDKTMNISPISNFLSSDLLFKTVFYINGFVCLFLFERAILKPFFNRRKQRFSM